MTARSGESDFWSDKPRELEERLINLNEIEKKDEYRTDADYESPFSKLKNFLRGVLQ